MRFRLDHRPNPLLAAAVYLSPIAILFGLAWRLGSAFTIGVLVFWGLGVVLVRRRAPSMELRVGAHGVQIDGATVAFEDVRFGRTGELSTWLALGDASWDIQDPQSVLHDALVHARSSWWRQPGTTDRNAMRRVQELQRDLDRSG